MLPTQSNSLPLTTPLLYLPDHATAQGPFKEDDGSCLRKCFVATKRIRSFRDADGQRQANFVRSILEAYGAGGQERLPLHTVLSWFLYYSTRIADDAHWGKNLSGMRFDLDGGLYVDALKDLKFVAGNAAIQFLRGPMFSNMLKGGEVKRGHYDISSWSEQQKLERLFFGGAMPSIQALNGRPNPEDQIDRGGTSAPLGRAVDGLLVAYRERMAELSGLPAHDFSSGERRRMLSKHKPFDGAAIDAALHGGYEYRNVFPKPPKTGWPRPQPWYAQEKPPAQAQQPPA